MKDISLTLKLRPNRIVFSLQRQSKSTSVGKEMISYLRMNRFRRILFFTESSASPNNYQLDWEHHYKEIKGSPVVKFEPNFIEITLKVCVRSWLHWEKKRWIILWFQETNSIGMTKKDSLHIRVVPYDTIGEARVGVVISSLKIRITLYASSTSWIKWSKRWRFWKCSST